LALDTPEGATKIILVGSIAIPLIRQKGQDHPFRRMSATRRGNWLQKSLERVMGGGRRQVDGTAGLPLSSGNALCSEALRLVPEADLGSCASACRSVEASLEHADEAFIGDPQEVE